MEFRFEEDFDESRVVLVISLISVLVRVFDFMTAAALCTLHLLHWLTVRTFFIFKAAAGSSFNVLQQGRKKARQIRNVLTSVWLQR